MQIARTTKARVVVGSIAATSLLLTACAGTSSTPAATSATTPAANATSASAPAASSTGSAAPTSAGGSGAPASTPSGGGAKETITVGLFGNIGFQAAGLYAEYEKLHPNITIKQDNVEQAADYYKALQTHLAAGSGLDDIQAIEIGFVADIVKHHVDQFVNFNSLPEGAQLKSTFYPWKWAEASNADQSKTIGVGTDAGPEAMCYRQDLLKQAGLPNDRATLAKQWATWTDFLAFGKKYQASATRPKNSAFLDSPGSIMAPVVNQGTLAYDDASGNPDVKNSDGVKQAWALASSAAAGKLTAGLGQFSPDWNRAFSNGAFAALA
jgi:cellobiose transport system substrate-binding protein